MTARIIEGRKLAATKEKELKRKVAELRGEGMELKLVSLVMEDDPAGELYTKLKQEAAGRIGVKLEKRIIQDLEADKIIRAIKELGRSDEVQGVIIQHPGVSWGKRQGMSREEFEDWWEKLVGAIAPEKDVDGLRPGSKFKMATVRAVAELLRGEGLKGARVAVVGSRGLVGRRLVEELKSEGYEVRGVDLGDKIAVETKKAEVLISATGKPGLITAEMVKHGAAVIDVGWPKGDVRLDEVKRVAAMITPVPGGIGPLTVVSLLENLVEGSYNTGTTHAYQPS
jgi:methylenetetrahydrofolate dehydrogenase (NADP+)/methenyltetrahydrofolate cyclohydrolase